MASVQESLFSLELVVEKLYIPYVTCRFPAVAFRLLDFPTILINHVEKELANGIKKKINSDPYYRVPNQFAELQDKQGNYMMKKGKSCLFKISAETLSMHLTNTPLYIMVIDEFPEVPKLLGNSSLALNEVMDKIIKDIKVNGPTVPSVQGDKGLFKIYSLMGKEIGYLIMGFRLLSLGPGLISHLPSTAFAKRASDKQKSKEKQPIVEEFIEVKEQQVTHSAPPPMHMDRRKRVDLNNTREMGSMTEVEKCDALMQTTEIDDNRMHVAVSENVEKQVKSIETQTEKRRKPPVKAEENFKVVGDDSDSDDGIIINPNIVCPPPLFYNSKAEPEVHIARDVNAYLGYSSTFDDATLEDISGDEHVDIDVKPNKFDKLAESEIISSSGIVKEKQEIQDARTVVISNIKGASDKVKSQPSSDPVLNLEALKSAEPVFPLLTALLTELSKIQNPQLVNQAMQQVSQLKGTVQQQRTTTAAPAALTKKSEQLENLQEVVETSVNVSARKRGRKGRKDRARSPEAVPKNKGWIRKAPELGVKKTKLVFGLTNTQRLRLAKQNPTWLETAEKEEKASKSQKQRVKNKEPEPDIDTGNLSDTYTEVRRLAAKELEKSTLARSQLIQEESGPKRLKKKSYRSRENSPLKTQSRMRSKSPKTKKTSSMKETVKVREDSDSLQETGAELAIDLEPVTKDRESPGLVRGDKQDSAADSVPSSRIEVHIPSAKAYYDSDDNENTFNNSYDEDMATDRKDTRSSKFPGFSRGDDTLPESIAPEGNQSFNTTLDEDSPLESTRVSKQFKQGPHTGESLFKSTDDYDTKQFHSTDEPELQKLMSEDEKSETQPTPVTDRSVRSQSPGLTAATNTNRLSMKFEVLNPKASQQSPLPAMRRSQQLKIDSMNARPTPTDTPRSRSSQGSPKLPTPRPRKQLRERRLEFKKESIHTESVSSYVPSETENILSLISDGSYSDDFHMSSEKDDSSKLSVPDLPKLIPSTKLGFTIN